LPTCYRRGEPRPSVAARPVRAFLHSEPIQILCLCTANVCRSPAAAALLEARLADRGIDADVRSAGRLSGGRVTTRENERVLRRYGIELAEHLSQEATPELVRSSDLVLGMAREHVADALSLAPEVFDRTFTLKELVRRAERVGARPDDVRLHRWLDEVGGGRDPALTLEASPDDDVADPIGRPLAAYEAMAADLSELTARLAELGWRHRRE
jgi:protein-tyrosine phosphatase